jgi:Fe-S cluster assembly iron-binding protein IscA
MALDEPRETDEVSEIDGFKFIVDKEFYEKIQPIKVDFTYFGFKVSSEMDFGAGAGCTSCGTTGTCG